MYTPTEDTKVDLVRPVFDECESPSDPLPSLAPCDEEDDDTRLLSRLSWPEPPRSLSERPRQEDARPAQLSRSVDGISRSVFISGGGKTPAFWCGLAAALSVAVFLSFVLNRIRSQPSSTEDVNASVPATRPIGAPGATDPTPSSPVGTATSEPPNHPPVAVPTKAPIDVTMLPRVPRAPPTNRFRRPTVPSVRAQTPAKVAAPAAAVPPSTPVADPVIDDGF
jgi:hypothetical protein